MYRYCPGLWRSYTSSRHARGAWFTSHTSLWGKAHISCAFQWLKEVIAVCVWQGVHWDRQLSLVIVESQLPQ